MPGPYTGGMTITATEYRGPNALAITFRADGHTTELVQCYVGKRLAATTRNTSDREIIVDIQATTRAIPLTLLAVDPAQAQIDYSSQLEWKPWNLYCITFTSPDPLPDDIDRYEIAMSTTAGAAYDSANIVGVVPHVAGRTQYTFRLPDIETDGDWEVAVIPRDNAKPSGNAGTADASTIAAIVYPLDLEPDADGKRFTITVSGGSATAAFTCSS